MTGQRLGRVPAFLDLMVELPERLAEIATRHKDLLARVERTLSRDLHVQARKEEARAAIEAGEYDRAERLLNEAKEAAIGAARRLKEELATQLLAAAASAAENGALARTRLRYRKAALYFAEAVDLLPEGSDEVRANYLNQQGGAAWYSGDYRMAVQVLRRVLDIRERIHAPDDPELAYGLNNLAVLYRAQSHYSAAEPLFQRAIAILEKALPMDHPHRMRVRENYAGLLDHLGRHAEAAELRAQTPAIRCASHTRLQEELVFGRILPIRIVCSWQRGTNEYTQWTASEIFPQTDRLSKRYPGTLQRRRSPIEQHTPKSAPVSKEQIRDAASAAAAEIQNERR